MARREFSEDFSTFFDPSTCVRRGLCPVRIQNTLVESHAIYFEQHGSGPEKVILIMGLNTTSFSWGLVLNMLVKNAKYSVVVFDNRGAGHSDTPRGPYTTSSMAEDTIALLDYIGWTGRRDLHVVGISLGGMVAQEMATRIPDRIVSLMLSVTTAGGHIWNNFAPWKGASTLTRMLFIKDPEVAITLAQEMLFPAAWLDEKSEDDPEGRTNREVKRLDSIARAKVTRKQTLVGMLSQIAAALTHYVSPERLRTISRSIPKIVILVGDEDHLVSPRNSAYLASQMPEAEYIVWENTGHAIHTQRSERYVELLERMFQEGREALSSGTFKEPS